MHQRPKCIRIFHKRWSLILECFFPVSILKNTSKLEWPIRDFEVDLGEKTGVSLNSGMGSFLKCHLVLILRQNSSKSLILVRLFYFVLMQSLLVFLISEFQYQSRLSDLSWRLCLNNNTLLNAPRLLHHI